MASSSARSTAGQVRTVLTCWQNTTNHGWPVDAFLFLSVLNSQEICHLNVYFNVKNYTVESKTLFCRLDFTKTYLKQYLFAIVLTSGQYLLQHCRAGPNSFHAKAIRFNDWRTFFFAIKSQHGTPAKMEPIAWTDVKVGPASIWHQQSPTEPIKSWIRTNTKSIATNVSTWTVFVHSRVHERNCLDWTHLWAFTENKIRLQVVSKKNAIKGWCQGWIYWTVYCSRPSYFGTWNCQKNNLVSSFQFSSINRWQICLAWCLSREIVFKLIFFIIQFRLLFS